MDSPRSSLKRVISKVRETPNAWVNVESVTLAPRGIVVALVLQKGRKGRALARWTVACRGVRELKVSDLTGGGIRLYASDHPAARQHAAAFVRLSCPTAGRAGVAWMALATAHRAAVDDWIHFDRYLPATLPQGNTLVVRAPDFLIRHYARALRRIGLAVRPSPSKRRPSRRKRPQVLHLGSSFVVAEEFLVQDQSAPRSRLSP